MDSRFCAGSIFYLKKIEELAYRQVDLLATDHSIHLGSAHPLDLQVYRDLIELRIVLAKW